MIQRITFTCLFVLSCALLTHAQEAGLVGTVTDPSGAVVAGAAVTAQNIETNVQRRVVSDARGRYSISPLTVGRYQLTVEAKGFRTLSVTDIYLTIGQKGVTDVTMQIGQLSEKVNVTDTSTLLQADQAAIGQSIENKKIVDLPLNGRDFTQLVALTPGATTAGNAYETGSPAVLIDGHRSTKTTSTIDGVRAECPELRSTIVINGDVPSGWTSFDGWLGDPIGDDEVRARRHDEAMQIYTSGTTGRPKGAVLNQVGLSNMLHQWRICYPFGQGERLLLAAPMYHVGGAYFSYHAIGHGGSVYLYADVDAETVVRDLDEQRITFAFLVPAMIQNCLTVPGVEQRRFDDFQLLAYGASPISEPALRKALATFHCKFVQAFGMTECPNVTYLTDEDHRRALAGDEHLLESTGRAGPGSEIKIVGEDGAELPAGEIGEILSRGSQIMRGYWNLPVATAEALVGGWMHTGDAGLIDEEGYLYVKDRIKDMIVSGAENVYPREIEEVLVTHPAVTDVAVIGVPSEQWGETVKAFVVLTAPGAASEDELIDFCRDKLAGYKRPRSIDVLDELPRNPSGKVLKRVLRAPYWDGHTRSVS